MTVDTSIEAVAKLLDGVTPGYWRVEYKHGTTRLMMGDSCQMCNETYYPWVPANERDWHFIAAARELVPALLAERDALKAEVDRLKSHPITVQDAAKVPEIAALIESATIVDDSYWNSTDGVIRGMYDLEVALRNITEANK